MAGGDTIKTVIAVKSGQAGAGHGAEGCGFGQGLRPRSRQQERAVGRRDARWQQGNGGRGVGGRGGRRSQAVRKGQGSAGARKSPPWQRHCPAWRRCKRRSSSDCRDRRDAHGRVSGFRSGAWTTSGRSCSPFSALRPALLADPARIAWPVFEMLAAMV